MERKRGPGLWLAVLIVLTAGGFGCDGGGSAPAPAGGVEAPRVYTVRGVVLETAADVLTIRHEAIDDYAGPEGKVIGMDSMVMRFQLAPQVHQTAVSEGDKVRFRVEARNTEPRYLVTEVKKLPNGTALDFRAARPLGQR